MASKGDNVCLSPQQIVRLAAAIAADNMASIAEGYMDIDDVMIKNLQYENKDNAEAFNREIIRHWTKKNPENQLHVIKFNYSNFCVQFNMFCELF